jgi:hypothetical protein
MTDLQCRVVLALFQRPTFAACAYPLAAELRVSLEALHSALVGLKQVECTGYSWRLTGEGAAWVRARLLEGNRGAA